MKTYNRIFPNHFSSGVFSIFFSASLLFSSCCHLLVSSCCHNVQADYSFHNHLNEDVQLFVYASGANLFGQNSYLIKPGDYAMIASLKTCDRGGFGNVIAHEVDSVRVVFSGSGIVIANWRNSGQYYLHDDFQHVPDFFYWWTWELYRLQHGGAHAEYRYFLDFAKN